MKRVGREAKIETAIRCISQEERPYLIAEMGLNHNGNLDLARRMIDRAVESGADAAKFQLYDSRQFIDHSAALNGAGEGSLQQFFARYQFEPRQWEELACHTSDRQLDFICSIFDEASLEFYRHLNSRLIKLASGEITNRLLFEKVAEGRWGVLWSSGAAEEWELKRARAWLGDNPSVLLQCVSAYPPQTGDYDLNVLPNWSRDLDCLVGLSDHFRKDWLSLASVALGARVIEKHFTLDRNAEGPDQAISLEPMQFRKLADGLQEVFAALGSGRKSCRPSEREAQIGARRSLYLKKWQPAGHTIGPDDLTSRRPGGGISPADYKEVVGCHLKADFGAQQPLARELLEKMG